MNRIALHVSNEPNPLDVTRIQHALIHDGLHPVSRPNAVNVWREYSKSCLTDWVPIDPTMPEGEIAALCRPFIERISAFGE